MMMNNNRKEVSSMRYQEGGEGEGAPAPDGGDSGSGDGGDAGGEGTA